MENKKPGIKKSIAIAAVTGIGAAGLSLLTGGPSAALATLEFEGATAGALGSLALSTVAAGKIGKKTKELEKELEKRRKEKELKKVI